MTPAPRLLFWETTAACNLRCIHCRRLDLLDHPAPDQLSTEEGLGLIDDLADLGVGVLVFSGGEPLVRTDIETLVRRAVSRGMAAAVATNGTLVDAARAKALGSWGVRRVSVSLDGSTAQTHEILRGPGSFARSVEGLRVLRSAGISTQINFTVTRKNSHQVDEMYELTRNLGADALHVFLLVPVGCGAEIPAEVRLDDRETEGILHRLADFIDAELRRPEGDRLFVKATCAPQFHRIVLQRKLKPPVSGRSGPMSAFTKGCLAGTGIAFVSHRGEVYPCGYLPIVAGSVRERPFSEIWRDSAVWSSFRGEELHGKCGACAFKFVCMGCRARAWAEDGDILAEDPDCAYVPKNWTGEAALSGAPEK